jgi:hypothetical protein
MSHLYSTIQQGRESGGGDLFEMFECGQGRGR